MDDAQTLFAVFFAILYTLMLGYAQNYNAWDTYDSWRGKRQSQRRFLLALILLNIIPILNFAWILSALATVTVNFEWNAAYLLVILLVVFLSFIVNGYYRVYVALLYRYPHAFYRSTRRIEYFTKLDEHGEAVSFGARFWPAVIYIAVPNGFLLLLLATKNPPAPSINVDPVLVNWILLGIVVAESFLLLALSVLIRRRNREIQKARVELAKCLESQEETHQRAARLPQDMG